MNSISITSLVTATADAKTLGIPPFYYRKRGSNYVIPGSQNISAQTYQNLKKIQNTIRVPSSIYSANKAPLNAYSKPLNKPLDGYYGVCWNQMSDRPVPSIQKATIPTGYGTSYNNRHHSVTSSHPGCQTPGGKGVDIKHNSYDRYLNRLKGKGPLRRGIVPPGFGRQIPFNQAYPIYGGKTLKTNIIEGCNCINNEEQNNNLYENKLFYPYPITNYQFEVGATVYTIKSGTDYYSPAKVININNNEYLVEFNDETLETKTISELKIYYPCECPQEILTVELNQRFLETLPYYARIYCFFASLQYTSIKNF